MPPIHRKQTTRSMCSYILEIYSPVDMTPYIENKRHSLCVLISCKTNIQPGGPALIRKNKQTNMVYMFLYLGKTNIQAGGHAPIPRKQTNTVYVFLYLKKKTNILRDMLLYLENKRTWSICSYIWQNKYTARGTCPHT